MLPSSLFFKLKKKTQNTHKNTVAHFKCQIDFHSKWWSAVLLEGLLLIPDKQEVVSQVGRSQVSM